MHDIVLKSHFNNSSEKVRATLTALKTSASISGFSHGFALEFKRFMLASKTPIILEKILHVRNAFRVGPIE